MRVAEKDEQYASFVYAGCRDAFRHLFGLRVALTYQHELRCIKCTGFGENRKFGFQDLATLRGGQVITEELGMNIDDLEFDMFGSCNKIKSNQGREHEKADARLRKMRQFEAEDGDDDSSDIDDLANRPKRLKSGISERTSTLSDLMDKLNSARNEEDIKACVEMRSQLYNRNKLTSEVKSDDTDASETPLEEDKEEDNASANEKSVYSPPKWF